MEENMVTIFLGPERFAVQVNSEILRSRSRYFTDVLDSPEKLDTRCTDVETRLKLIKFLQSSDVKRDLREEGSNLLGVVQLLKYFHDDGFYDGAVACLEYIEAVPWTEGEGRFIGDYLREMVLYEPFTEAALARLPSEPLPLPRDGIWNLMIGATRNPAYEEQPILCEEIRNLISEVITGEPAISKDGQQVLLEFAFVQSSKTLLTQSQQTLQIAMDAKYLIGMIRQVCQNLIWLLGLMMTMGLADDAVEYWTKKTEIRGIYNRMRRSVRCDILMIPITMCIGIGSKKIIAPMEARCSLLKTWLPFIYADYEYLTGLKYFVNEEAEEGIGKVILTLPFEQQNKYFEEWFEIFQSGRACPNLRRAYQVWWRLSHSLSFD